MSVADDVLAVLDDCSRAFTFPALDNGYVYLAATRLRLFRSPSDWALTIEVFGFSPRAGDPDTHIYTFSSAIRNRQPASNYVSAGAASTYLANNPHNDSKFVHPLDSSWIDPDEPESVNPQATQVVLRGQPAAIPNLRELELLGIRPSQPPRLMVFELCRFLADRYRNQVLAQPDEVTHHVPLGAVPLMQLEGWNHPDVVGGDRPSGSATFQQLARVLDSGDPTQYRPVSPSNTHWSFWFEGGSL